MAQRDGARAEPRGEVREVRGVLLDVDGTLVDSNDAHAQAWVDVFARNGYDVSFEAVRRLIGMGGDKLLPTTIGVEKESEEGKRLAEERTRRFFDHYVSGLQPFPGVRPLLERMRDEGLTLVVATSANEEELERILDRAGVADLMAETTSASDAKRSKPDPDIIAAAVERSGHEAGALVMIGDTPYDVEAATRAGVRVVGFRCGGWWSDDDFAGAAAIYDGPQALLDEYEESLFARAGSSV